MPQLICAESYLSAVQKFGDQRENSTSLTHIHFVDVNDDMVTTIQQTFTAKWNTVTGQQTAATPNKVSNSRLSTVKIPRLGTMDTQNTEIPSVENPELSKDLSLKLGVGQNRALSTVRDSAFLNFTFSVHSTSFCSPQIFFSHKIACIITMSQVLLRM